MHLQSIDRVQLDWVFPVVCEAYNRGGSCLDTPHPIAKQDEKRIDQSLQDTAIYHEICSVSK